MGPSIYYKNRLVTCSMRLRILFLLFFFSVKPKYKSFYTYDTFNFSWLVVAISAIHTGSHGLSSCPIKEASVQIEQTVGRKESRNAECAICPISVL